MKKYYFQKGCSIKASETKEVFYNEEKQRLEFPCSKLALDKLIDGHYIEVVDVEEKKQKEFSLAAIKPYIKQMSKKTGLSFTQVCAILLTLHNIAPKTHLQLLIEVIAEVKNKDKKKNPFSYYLDPLAKYKPVETTLGKDSAAIFYSKVDAEKTYKFLLPLIETLND